MKNKIKKKDEKSKNYFKESVSYIKECKKEIYVMVAIFSISISIGIIFNKNLLFLEKYITEIIESTKDLSGIDLTSFIFINNSTSAFISLFLGIFLGIIPIMNSILNGVLVGYVIQKIVYVTNILEIWRLFPHGIFELPAIFISLGLGLNLGISIFKKDGFSLLKRNIKKSLIVFFFVIMPLLIIAAAIEGILIVLTK